MRQRRPSPEIFCIHGIFGELSSPPSSTWGSGIGFGLLSSLAPLPHARFERGLLQQFAGNIDWFLVNTLGSLIAIGPDTPVGLPDLTASSTPSILFNFTTLLSLPFPMKSRLICFSGCQRSLDARPTSTAKSVVPESSHPRTHTYGFP